MAHKRCARLHAEYKPMLSMLNVVLDLSGCIRNGCGEEATDTEPCYVDIEVDTITYRSATSQAVFFLKHLQMSPASCRGLRWCSPSELHLSVQAKSSQEKGLNVKWENGVINQVEEESCLNNQDIMVNRLKQCHNRCYCAGCGRPVFTSKSVFKRVLPLPSENWSDFADIWFCHNHSHQTGSQSQCQDTNVNSQASSTLPHDAHHHQQQQQQQPKHLSPRPGDCLVSSLYLLVDSSQVCRSTVGTTPRTQRLVCMRCGNFIGFVKQKADHSQEVCAGGDVYKIYLHAIKFSGPETRTSCDLTSTELPLDGISQDQNDSLSESLVEDFLCQLFRDQSRLFTSFRFIVQSSHEEHSDNLPIVLLVWLLDQNLEVFSSASPLSAVPSKSSAKEVPVTRVLKLLYKGHFASKESKKSGAQGSIFKMWERDNTVHGLDLPYPLCKQLLSLLISSTRHLPLSQRSLNSFHVGYLHYRPALTVTPN